MTAGRSSCRSTTSSTRATSSSRARKERSSTSRSRGRSVAFQIDAIDPMYHGGFSVLAYGAAEVVDAPDEIERLSELPLLPWWPGSRDRGSGSGSTRSPAAGCVPTRSDDALQPTRPRDQSPEDQGRVGPVPGEQRDPACNCGVSVIRRVHAEEVGAMQVLVNESDPHAAGIATAQLEARGHQVKRCRDPEGSMGFPCVGLTADRCPLEDGAVDVALTVRADSHPSPTPLEDGISCALRRRIPVVVAGHTTSNPFAAFGAVAAGHDVVGTCEQTAAARRSDHEGVASRALDWTLRFRDLPLEHCACRGPARPRRTPRDVVRPGRDAQDRSGHGRGSGRRGAARVRPVRPPHRRRL